jgi:hypothetical protein
MSREHRNPEKKSFIPRPSKKLLMVALAVSLYFGADRFDKLPDSLSPQALLAFITPDLDDLGGDQQQHELEIEAQANFPRIFRELSTNPNAVSELNEIWFGLSPHQQFDVMRKLTQEKVVVPKADAVAFVKNLEKTDAETLDAWVNILSSKWTGYTINFRFNFESPDGNDLELGVLIRHYPDIEYEDIDHDIREMTGQSNPDGVDPSAHILQQYQVQEATAWFIIDTYDRGWMIDGRSFESPAFRE